VHVCTIINNNNSSSYHSGNLLSVFQWRSKPSYRHGCMPMENQLRIQSSAIQLLLSSSAKCAISGQQWQLYCPPTALVDDCSSRSCQTQLMRFKECFRQCHLNHSHLTSIKSIKQTLFEYNSQLAGFKKTHDSDDSRPNWEHSDKIVRLKAVDLVIFVYLSCSVDMFTFILQRPWSAATTQDAI